MVSLASATPSFGVFALPAVRNAVAEFASTSLRYGESSPLKTCLNISAF